MLVEDVMKRDLITVQPGTTLPEALRLSRERGVRHLPVLDGQGLVGIVSDRDLKRAMASPATSLERHELDYLLDKVTMDEIMTRAVITVGPMLPVEEAARIMVKEKISALPVTQQGRIVGIVTETDILDLFLAAMGAGEPSSRLDVLLPEGRDRLADAVHTIEAAGAGISSIVTLPGRGGRKEIVIRVPTIDPGAAIARLRARGFTVLNPWRG